MKKNKKNFYNQDKPNDYLEKSNAYNYSGYGDVDYGDIDNSFDELLINTHKNTRDFSTNKIYKIKPKKQIEDTHTHNEKNKMNENILNLVDICIKQFLQKKDSKNIKAEKKNSSNKILDIAKDSLVSILGNVLMGDSEDSKDSCSRQVDNKSSDEYSNVLNSNDKKNVYEKKQLIKFKQLQACLDLDNDSMIAILQEISGQNSYSFSFIKYNVDKSVLFFEDDNNHIFPVPIEKIIEYANLLNS